MIKFRRVFTLACALVATTRVPGVWAGPTVQLDDATVTGTSFGRTNSFLGIPFALPPTGDRRFRVPEPIPSYTTSFSALAFGKSCPQQLFDTSLDGNIPQEVLNLLIDIGYGVIFPQDEDCLTINVVKPANVDPDAKLPVAVWIFGGGFELGSPSMYDGKLIVERSIDLGEPIIYVSMNYRVTALGFLAGKEVKEAGVGNLGLLDQREALRWVQKYIGEFGGDPDKVTIWGESAGAISVALHMVANDGDTEGLFRGGFMQSGAPIPVGQVDSELGQRYFDNLVADSGCSDADDKLQCLREVDFDTLQEAINNSPNIFSYQSLVLAWLPRADGTFISDNPQKLVQAGKVADIPFVNGDCDDEGTLFSFSTLNVTTTEEFGEYILENWLPETSEEDLDRFEDLYPDDITQGSPFDTGVFNAVTPQFKRIAAFQGDVVFQAPRRFFMESVSGKQDQWGYINKRLKGTPILGTFHASDILQSYGGTELTNYLIHFVTNLDPNGGNEHNWPKYTKEEPNLLAFLDGFIPLQVQQDTYRKEAMEFLTELSLEHPI